MISIIVPVYNAEHKVNNLIKSLLGQSSKDFEVIFIDDKSTDSTVDYLNRKLKNENINYKIISNMENVGPGSSRNKGIKKSKCDYIMFVDADDFIDEDTIRDFIRIIEKEMFDILIFDYNRKNNNSSLKFKSVRKHTADLSSDNLILNGNLSTMCKLYSKNLLTNNKLLFPPLYLGEDTIFTINAILHSKKNYYLEKAYYTYDIQEDSLTMTKPKRSTKNEYINRFNYLKTELLKGDIKDYLYVRLVISAVVDNMIIHKEKNKLIKKTIDELYKNMNPNFNIKTININREHKFMYNSILKKKIIRYKLYRKIKMFIKRIF